MSCPFAAPQRSTAKSDDAARLPSGALSSPLSDHLRKGTAAAHAAIERSPGVKLLLASVSSTLGQQNEAMVKRLDYLRWLIMLHALYSTLETMLFALSAAQTQRIPGATPHLLGTALLTPLLQASGGELLPTLARTKPLLSDISVHSALVEAEEGASLDDLAEALALEYETPTAQEAAGPTSPSKAQALDLLPHIWALQARVQPDMQTTPAPPSTWLALLTPVQKETVGGYVARLVALALRAGVDLGSRLASSEQLNAWVAYPPSTGPIGGAVGAGALLTHAYTRYLGDLSGGQFIAKHVRNKWPVPTPINVAAIDIETHTPSIPEDGLAFYSFLGHSGHLGPRLAQDPPEKWVTDPLAKARAERALKDAFRTAANGAVEYASIVQPTAGREDVIQAMVDEATLSFLLNGALFDALAGLDPGDQNLATEAIARANARARPSTAGAETAHGSKPHHSHLALALKGGVVGGVHAPSWLLMALPLLGGVMALSLWRGGNPGDWSSWGSTWVHSLTGTHLGNLSFVPDVSVRL